jgi:hypothetical protein
MSDQLENLPVAGTLQADDLLYVVQDGDSRQTSVGALRVVPIRTTTVSSELVEDDNYVRVNAAGATNITVPSNSDVGFPIGTQITIVQVNVGQVTVVAGSGVTILTSETLKLRKPGSAVTITKVATDGWELAGDVELAA